MSGGGDLKMSGGGAEFQRVAFPSARISLRGDGQQVKKKKKKKLRRQPTTIGMAEEPSTHDHGLLPTPHKLRAGDGASSRTSSHSRANSTPSTPDEAGHAAALRHAARAERDEREASASDVERGPPPQHQHHQHQHRMGGGRDRGRDGDARDRGSSRHRGRHAHEFDDDHAVNDDDEDVDHDDSDEYESDDDGEESGVTSHSRGSKASSRSNLSTKSYPRAMAKSAYSSKRRERERGGMRRGGGGGVGHGGYMSEEPHTRGLERDPRWPPLGASSSRALRSSLRKDMETIVARALRQKQQHEGSPALLGGPHGGGGGSSHVSPYAPFVGDMHDASRLHGGGGGGGGLHQYQHQQQQQQHHAIPYQGYQTMHGPPLLPVHAPMPPIAGMGGSGGGGSTYGWGWPFIAGCVVSCLGVSYIGLMVFVVARG